MANHENPFPHVADLYLWPCLTDPILGANLELHPFDFAMKMLQSYQQQQPAKLTKIAVTGVLAYFGSMVLMGGDEDNRLTWTNLKVFILMLLNDEKNLSIATPLYKNTIVVWPVLISTN